MQLYFNTFDFATISMSQTDFVSYLGKLLKRRLYWRRWRDNAGDKACKSDTLLKRNNRICVASPNVANASKDSCRCHWRYRQQMSPM
jgi:hypothetical protein